jgi:hypothetical protein
MEIKEQAHAMMIQLDAFPKIMDADDYRQALDLFKEGQAMLKAIDDRCADDIDFAHKEHKRLLAERDAIKKPVEEATKRIKRMAGDWKAEEERKARLEALRLEAEARKAAEERKLQEAIAAEAAGDRGGADAIMEETITLPPAYVPPPVPKVEGVVFREIWQFEIVDAAALPRDYLVPDEVRIGQVVRAMKGLANIPGVRAFSKKV